MQPYLNAFRFDPRQPDLGGGIAQYNASYSNAATLDAFSLRLDHRLNNKWALSGRYNYSPSKIIDRGANDGPLSVVAPTGISIQTLTLGAATTFSPVLANDFHFNFSRPHPSPPTNVDNFVGAVPLPSFPLTNPFTYLSSTS